MTIAPIRMERIDPPADHWGKRLDCHLNDNAMTQARKEVELLRQLHINGEMTMHEMLGATGFSESAATRALKALKNHALVSASQAGKKFLWRLRAPR